MRLLPSNHHPHGHLNSSPYTLTFALGFSALALGGVHTSVLLACGGGLSVGAALQLGRSQGASRWEGWAWAALVTYCLLQLCPMPYAWLAAVAPRNADVWARAVRPWGEAPPAWASVSLAPGRTWIEALKVASAGLAFYLGRSWTRERGSTGVRRVIFGCAIAVAAISLGHQALGADTLYGFYRLRDATDVAPLPNGNSRAGYLLLGLFCGLPDALGRSRHLPIATTGLLLVGLALLTCESRSGTLCLGLGLASAALWLPLSTPAAHGPRGAGDRARLLRRLCGIGLGVLGVTVMYQAVSPQGGLGGLLSDSSSKLELLAGASRMASGFWLLGVGRGAFGSVFPSVQSEGHTHSYEHAENFVLQWASEWGWGATALVLGGLSLSFITALRRVGLRDPSRNHLQPPHARARRCCLLGLGWLAIQNGLDLGFELPAVAMAAAALLGALSSGPKPRDAGPKAPPQPTFWRERAPWAALLASAGLCLGGSAFAGAPALPRLRRAMQEQQRGSRPRDPRDVLALRQAVQWFPGEPFFPLVASGLAQRAGTDPLPWAALALERAPRSVETHRAVAEALAARGAIPQALDTLRVAAQLPGLPDETLASSVWRVARAVEPALRAVPPGAPGTQLLAALGRISVPPLAARRAFLQAALAREPQLREVRLALAQHWLNEAKRPPAKARHEEGAVPSDTTAPYRAGALRKALELLQQQPGADRELRVLEARVLTALGRYQSSEKLLREVCRAPARSPCPQAWLELDLKQNREGEASANAWLATACSGADACARANREIARLHTEYGQLGHALRYYRQASVAPPSRATYLDLAQAAERAGHPNSAQRARERAAALSVDTGH